MSKLIVIAVVCISFVSYSQSKFKSFLLDADDYEAGNEYFGLGLEVSRPYFGKRTKVESNWYGFNLLAGFLEAKLSFGQAQFSEPIIGFGDGTNTPRFSGRTAFGTDFTLGVNAALPSIGRYDFEYKRVQPTIAMSLGGTSFIESKNRGNSGTFYHFGVGIGARIRLPLMTIEPGIRFNVGLYSHNGDNDALKYGSIIPSIIFRFDSRKDFIDGESVSVKASTYSVSNVKSKSNTRSNYRGNTKTTTTTTTTTANVSSSSGSVKVLDIGDFVAIGPKFGFNSFKTKHYMNRGWIAGVNLTARKSVFLGGLNIEYGKMGHGTEIKNEASRLYKRVDRSIKINGDERFTTFQAYADIGVDITTIPLSLLGLVREFSGTTNLTALTLGYSVGFAGVNNDKYSSDLANSSPLPDDQTKFNNILLNKSGLVSGFFLGLEVGVVSFRAQGFKYKNAPLLNNTYYSIAYRIPLHNNL